MSIPLALRERSGFRPGDVVLCKTGRKARLTMFRSTGHWIANYLDGDKSGTILQPRDIHLVDDDPA